MHDVEEHPVLGDPAAVAALEDQVHVLDTIDLTAHARTLGLTPPDERPAWYVILKYDADLNERGLFWIGPDDE